MSTSSAIPNPTLDPLKEQIRAFWEARPCGAHFGGDDVGSLRFFERLERHRYTLEPHILRAADFGSSRGLKVLEVGCGLGTDAVQFARAGADYTGIDLTSRAISLTRRRFSLLHLRGDLHVGDAERLEFPDNAFDLVYSHGVLHHTPDIRAAIKEVFRVLRPGGRAAVMLYHRHSLNHYVKIRLLRRIRAPLLRTNWGLSLLQRLWAEPVDELQSHAEYMRSEPERYLHPAEFLSRNTDGARCPVSRVYSVAEVRALFAEFERVRCRTYSRTPVWWPHEEVFGHILDAIGKRWGWHLWVDAWKPYTVHQRLT